MRPFTTITNSPFNFLFSYSGIKSIILPLDVDSKILVNYLEIEISRSSPKELEKSCKVLYNLYGDS